MAIPTPLQNGRKGGSHGLCLSPLEARRIGVRTTFTCELRTDFWNKISDYHHLVRFGLPLKVIYPTIQIWNLYEQAFIIYNSKRI